MPKKTKLTKEVREYMAEIGAKGGSDTGKRKQDAVRKNGKLGGRPKKIPTKTVDKKT